MKTSRHTILQQENTTKYPTAVVALQEEGGWRFYDVFKRLTQGGELVIMSHGNVNATTLEHGQFKGFSLHEPGTEPEFGGWSYPLPKLELNTATVGLLSCFSGSKVNDESLGTKVLEILDTGPVGLDRHNRVDCFDGISTAGHALYYIDFDYPHLQKWRDEIIYRKVHGEYGATVDGWNSVIASSGVDPANPVDYQPFTGNSPEMLTERWTLQIKAAHGEAASVKPGVAIKVDMYKPARDFYYTLPYPPAGQTQAAQIWEAPLIPKAGNPLGIKRADITYSGIANLIGPSGIAGITEEIEPAEGNVLLLRIMIKKEDDTLTPRGGSILLRRYALQKYKIEEEMMPDESGVPGGDRLKRLREIHDQIDIGGGVKASEYSSIKVHVTTTMYQYNESEEMKTSLDNNHIVLISPTP